MRTWLPCVIWTAVACTELPERDPNALPNWDDYQENVPTGETGLDTGAGNVPPPEPPDTQFNLNSPDDVSWPVMLRRWDPLTGTVFPDEPCAIDLTNVPAGEAVTEDCILEMNEANLFFQGARINTHVPEDYCDYLFAIQYRYQAFPVGDGPTEVRYDFDPVLGTFVDYDTDGDGVPESEDGVPVCQYNLLGVGGPNCCTGYYTLSARDLSTGEVEETLGFWGGEATIGYCFDGAGYLLDGASFAENHLPRDPFFYLDRAALDHAFTYRGPAEAADQLQDGYATNIALANYVNVADHNGQLPVSLQDVDGTGLVRTTTDFICTNDALEKYGVIRLTIREWNEESQFGADGNPDSREGEFENIPPFQPYDDVLDWRALDLLSGGLFQTFYVGFAD